MTQQRIIPYAIQSTANSKVTYCEGISNADKTVNSRIMAALGILADEKETIVVVILQKKTLMYEVIPQKYCINYLPYYN